MDSCRFDIFRELNLKWKNWLASFSGLIILVTKLRLFFLKKIENSQLLVYDQHKKSQNKKWGRKL